MAAQSAIALGAHSGRAGVHRRRLFWYLPVIGIEWLVVGLLLLAQDVPFLRGPVARFTLWLEAQWCRLKRWWRRRRARNGVVRPTRRGC